MRRAADDMRCGKDVAIFRDDDAATLGLADAHADGAGDQFLGELLQVFLHQLQIGHALGSFAGENAIENCRRSVRFGPFGLGRPSEAGRSIALGLADNARHSQMTDGTSDAWAVARGAQYRS